MVHRLGRLLDGCVDRPALLVPRVLRVMVKCLQLLCDHKNEPEEEGHVLIRDWAGDLLQVVGTGYGFWETDDQEDAQHLKDTTVLALATARELSTDAVSLLKRTSATLGSSGEPIDPQKLLVDPAQVALHPQQAKMTLRYHMSREIVQGDCSLELSFLEAAGRLDCLSDDECLFVWRHCSASLAEAICSLLGTVCLGEDPVHWPELLEKLASTRLISLARAEFALARSVVLHLRGAVEACNDYRVDRAVRAATSLLPEIIFDPSLPFETYSLPLESDTIELAFSTFKLAMEDAIETSTQDLQPSPRVALLTRPSWFLALETYSAELCLDVSHLLTSNRCLSAQCLLAAAFAVPQQLITDDFAVLRRVFNCSHVSKAWVSNVKALNVLSLAVSTLRVWCSRLDSVEGLSVFLEPLFEHSGDQALAVHDSVHRWKTVLATKEEQLSLESQHRAACARKK